MRETTNYKLGLWDAQDEVGRQAVNANFTALDSALKGEADARAAGNNQLAGQMAAGLGKKVEVVIGTYMGDDAETRVIQLGQTPIAVYLNACNGFTASSTAIRGGMALPGHPVLAYLNGSTHQPPAVEVVEGGFLVRELAEDVAMYQITANAAGMEYRYMAFFM